MAGICLSLFGAQKWIDLCFASIEQLDQEIVHIATRMTQPDTLSYFDPDREADSQRIEWINKIKARKLAQS